MKVITAVENYDLQPDEISVFLAGGITNCPDWQSDIIKRLDKYNLDRLVIFNPRRENFPIGVKSESFRQVEWEFKYLEKCDIFSMYFCSGTSDQPICMYELGRYIARMQSKYPVSWKDRVIVSVEKGYKREDDVYIQSFLACGSSIINRNIDEDGLKFYHVKAIVDAYIKLSN